MKIIDQRGNSWHITCEWGEAQQAQREMKARVTEKEQEQYREKEANFALRLLQC